MLRAGLAPRTFRLQPVLGELCVQAARVQDPDQFGQESDAKDDLINNVIAHSVVQSSTTHVNSAQHGTAKPVALYIIITLSISFARRPIRCRETFPCFSFLYSFPGSWVDHVTRFRPPRGYLTWWSCAGTACFHASEPERREFTCIRYRFVDFLASRRLQAFLGPPAPGRTHFRYPP